MVDRSIVQQRVSCRDPRLKIQRANGYKQRRFLHFVRDAVYAVAHALDDMRADVCGRDSAKLCDAMRPPDGDAFAGYLANVSFKGKVTKE